MTQVMVLGSLNMDLSIETDVFPRNGETVTGQGFITNPGGKGSNQAVALAKSGTKTIMIGATGKDAFGEQLMSSLTSYGVTCDAVQSVSGYPTGVAMIIRYEQDNRIVLEPGANHALRSDEVERVLRERAKHGDIFLTQLENDFDVALNALHAAQDLGLFTVLNPAPARALPEETYRQIDLLIVNQSESELLSGIYPEDAEACRRVGAYFEARGVGATLVTLGKYGSVYISNDETIFVPSFDVETVDTTGAGDTYIGAFLAAYARRESVEESMIYGTKASALTVGKLGAQRAIPTREAIERFTGHVYHS